MWAAAHWQLMIVPTCCILTEAWSRKIERRSPADVPVVKSKYVFYVSSWLRARACVAALMVFTVYSLHYVCVLLRLHWCARRMEAQM